MMFTINNFVAGFSNCFQGANLEIGEDWVIMKEDGTESEFGKIPVSELRDQETFLSNEFKFQDAVLSSTRTYEVPVMPQNMVRGTSLRYFGGRDYSCEKGGYLFEILPVSREYLFALICKAGESNGVFDVRRARGSKIESMEQLASESRILAVKIISPGIQSHDAEEFQSMADSYLFNIAYYYNTVLRVDNLRPEYRMNKRDPRLIGQLFPDKKYNHDLLTYYSQATSNDIPFMQYLHYYHVAEFFFEQVAEKEAIREIRDILTGPSFSLAEDKDVKGLYSKMKKREQDNRNGGEKLGLLNTLKKYVPDINDLMDTIHSIDTTAVDYYENHEVEFADEGKRIKFSDPAGVFKAIRDRVYSVRNAVAHSKEGERSRYEPYKHDKQLAKELPLIRAIAEKIIINSADSMAWKFDT